MTKTVIEVAGRLHETEAGHYIDYPGKEKPGTQDYNDALAHKKHDIKALNVADVHFITLSENLPSTIAIPKRNNPEFEIQALHIHLKKGE